MYVPRYLSFFILITKTGRVCNITFIAIKFCRKLIIGILILKFGNTKFKQFRAEHFRMVDILCIRDIQKRGLKRKSKVCTLDIQIKQSGLRISHSNVFSSVICISYCSYILQFFAGISIKL